MNEDYVNKMIALFKGVDVGMTVNYTVMRMMYKALRNRGFDADISSEIVSSMKLEVSKNFFKEAPQEIETLIDRYAELIRNFRDELDNDFPDLSTEAIDKMVINMSKNTLSLTLEG